MLLKIGLRVMICTVNVLSYWFQSTPPRRIALTPVHYYSHFPSLQQSKPAFVSYIGSDELTTEFQQGKIWASNKDLKISIQSSHLKNKLYYKGELEDLEVGDDVILLSGSATDLEIGIAQAFTAYKKVDRKVKPVPGTFPQEALVRRSFPHDPLEGLPMLSKNPPEFIPTQHITAERYKQMNINSEGFMRPEEEKLFAQVLLSQ
jgi:hypothetical protein